MLQLTGRVFMGIACDSIKPHKGKQITSVWGWKQGRTVTDHERVDALVLLPAVDSGGCDLLQYTGLCVCGERDSLASW